MSGFISLGKAAGELAEHDKGDPPDPDLVEILHQHLDAFGLTSSGMTQHWKPWMKVYAENWLYEQRRKRVLAKRDAHRERMRQERMTEPALGSSRRGGRL